MLNQERSEGGKFAPKSEKPRQVRSIRVTDEAWERLGVIAKSRRITRADLLEEAVEEGWIEKPKTKKEIIDEIQLAVNKILGDANLTRQGKDKSAIKRGLLALVDLIS